MLAIFVGVLATLRHFGVDPTPALAGLGVGGIAVALAAQKTLENVIAGASLIFDQAVTTGDFLKMGEISGTVDHIGLRSTRIRTLDRTIVSVPNSQIANACLETLSARDKFWFHHVVGLRYETTPDQLRAVVDGIRGVLASQPLTDRDSVRVRFLRLGAFSLDVDVFAYLRARRLESLPRAAGAAALRHHRCRRPGRRRNRVSVADDVCRWTRSSSASRRERGAHEQLWRRLLFLIACGSRARFEAAAERQVQIDALDALLGLHADEGRAAWCSGRAAAR